MFDPTCSRCGNRVLLGYRQLEGMTNHDDGIVMHFRCHCGGPATLRTGNRRHPSPVA
jgi:hypothetical protein